MAADPLAQLDAGPIFVVGVARSGTTWVHDALAAHPLVGAVFETELFQPAGLLGLLDRSRYEPKPKGIARLIPRDELVAGVREFAGWLFARGLLPEHRYLVEKTPGHVMHMPAIAQAFPDARFVHVIRDGRDVCVSTRAATSSWAKSWNVRTGVAGVAQIARRWKRGVAQGQADAPALPGHVLEVRYEVLRADPRAGYRQLLDFATIPYDDDTIEAIHRRVDFDTTGRAQDTVGFYRAGRVGDWRKDLNIADCVAFDAVAGDALVALGYADNRRWWVRR